MNIFQKLTLQSLKKNRTRTIVTIIGIILSAAMICAVTTSVSSLQKYMKEYSIYTNGDWHGMASRVTYQDYEDIEQDECVAEVEYAQIVGYAKIDSDNTYKPYMYVLGGEEGIFDRTLPVHLIKGQLPTSQDEIILPEHLETYVGQKYEIGDQITLELGNRTLDGYTMGQENPCYYYDWEKGEDVLNNEKVDVQSVRTYTVVGFYERPTFEDYSAPGFTALTIADARFPENAEFEVYYKMVNPSETYDFMDTLDLGGTCNTDLLLFSGVSRYNTFNMMLTSLATIVIGLIMFGSISLIYNAFAISVSERTKQFGLLTSLGATKKQLKEMVFFEAFVVSAIGIPLGILSGIGGIGVTLYIVGNKFSSMIGNGFDQPMRICVSWQSIVIAAVIALITVLISAWIPSKRATKVTAVEAIRQNADIKMSKRPVKTSKLTYKLFGLPGVLASKYYKRNRKKYRTTVVSLFMSIVLFVSASAFSGYLMESVTGGLEADKYDLWYLYLLEESENCSFDEMRELLLSEEHVSKVSYSDQRQFVGNISDQYLTDSFIEDAIALAANGGGDELLPEDTKQISGYLYFIDDEEFENVLKENKLNREEYFDPENPLGIALDGNIQFDGNKQRYVTLDTLKGDECQIECWNVKSIENYEYKGSRERDGEIYYYYENIQDSTQTKELTFEESHLTYTLKAKKTITEAPFCVPDSSHAHLKMLYPISMVNAVMGNQLENGKTISCVYYMESDDHEATYENLKTLVEEIGDNPEMLYDYAAEVESGRNIVIILQVFSYGFIVLISLIAAVNVFNTISTNISLRRREFAMLKSVGMTQKGFNRMMNYECLLYGSKALIWGIPVSAGITYLIYLAIANGYETTYHLPWTAIGIAVISVFAVVFATMLYSMSKIKKENPIDALKNENI